MDRITFLFRATTLWFVSILTWRELAPVMDTMPWYTLPFAVAFAAYYFIPAYVIWRFTEDVRDRIWQRWLEYLNRR